MTINSANLVLTLHNHSANFACNLRFWNPGLRFAHPIGPGKRVDYLVFEDERHDVLKRPNRVRCYETIVVFFR